MSNYHIDLYSGLSYSELETLIYKLSGLELFAHRSNGPGCIVGLKFSSEENNTWEKLSHVKGFIETHFSRWIGRVEILENSK